uniref:Conotoxin Cl9.2 n=1 Tax=Californiconus californicus TaxID=1736779 RepID=CU92_CONCL
MSKLVILAVLVLLPLVTAEHGRDEQAMQPEKKTMWTLWSLTRRGECDGKKDCITNDDCTGCLCSDFGSYRKCA